MEAPQVVDTAAITSGRVAADCAVAYCHNELPPCPPAAALAMPPPELPLIVQLVTVSVALAIEGGPVADAAAGVAVDSAVGHRQRRAGVEAMLTMPAPELPLTVQSLNVSAPPSL